jgi:predicted MFS family arabinose efflux permease
MAMVAVSFGLARYGYGLLLPDIRRAFALSSATLGLIGAGSYAAYLVATVATPVLVARAGARRPVLLGGVLAVAGMLLVAAAPGPAALAAGVLVAGAAGGLVYPPFSEAVARAVASEQRARALSLVSAGTGWGVLLAAPVALAVGDRWRLAWVAFAALALVATVATARALAGVAEPDAAAGRVAPPLRWSWFVCPRSGPLLGSALLVGIGSSVYWTFAADLVASGPLPAAWPALLLAVVGVASVVGSGAGDLVRRLGGRTAFASAALLLALALVVLALGRGSWPAVLASGLLFGATYNVALAVQAIWSTVVFARHPAAGLAAVMFMSGTGLLVGPALGGLLADAAGLGTAFAAGAGVAAAAAALAPRELRRP